MIFVVTFSHVLYDSIFLNCLLRKAKINILKNQLHSCVGVK